MTRSIADVRALLSPGAQVRVLATPASVDGGRFRHPAARVVPERELARAVRDADRPTAVAIGRPSPTLVRAVRDRPPALLVVCGDVDEDGRAALAAIERDLPTPVLGPEASFAVSDGGRVLCAPSSEELERLVEAAGPFRLALAPTPAWLATWLSDPALEACQVIGCVDWEALGPAWAAWSQGARLDHVVVPLGVREPALDRPREPALDRAVAAHALERVTGPVFPAPRVLATVAAGLRADPRADGSPTDTDPVRRGLWAQARRALPATGAWLGMEDPDPHTPETVPTAAFLAQRALLHARRARALLDGGFRPPPEPQAEDCARALEVLAATGESLSEHESKVVLRGFSIEITRQAVAGSASGAAHFAERIGFPVVLKAVSPDLRRKSEVGAVRLGLGNAAAVRRAYASILQSVEEQAPAARLDGVLVAELVGPGLEIHCGALRRADGSACLFGRPTGLPSPVEAVFVGCPVDRDRALLFAHAVLARVQVPALRRASDPDPHRLAELVLRLSALLDRTGDRISAIELAPVRFLDDPARPYVVLDARVTQRAHLDGT